MWLVFTSIVLSIVLIANRSDIVPSNIDGVKLTANLETIENHFGNDFGSYAKGALIIKKSGMTGYINSFHKNWSPGMSIIESLLFSISPGLPIPLALLLISSLIWGLFFSLIYTFGIESLKITPLQASTPILILMLTPQFNSTLFWELLLGSEPLSCGLFFTGLVIFLKCLFQDNKNFKELILWQLISSLFFIMSTFVRAQFDIIFICMILSYLLFIGFYFLFTGTFNIKIKLLIQSIIVVVATYFACTIPYRIAVNANGLMVENSYVWKLIWHEKDYFKGDFFASGGGHSVCTINPVTCQSFNLRESGGKEPTIAEAKLAAIKTVLLNPVKFTQYKSYYLLKHWLGIDALHSINFKSLELIINIIILPIIIFILLFSIFNKKIKLIHSISVLSLTIGIGLGSILFSIFIHFEYRYFLPIKIFLIILESYFLLYLFKKTLSKF